MTFVAYNIFFLTTDVIVIAIIITITIIVIAGAIEIVIFTTPITTIITFDTVNSICYTHSFVY